MEKRYVKERSSLVGGGLTLLKENLTVGSGGNLSVRAGDQMLITPSGIAYEALTPEDMILMEYEGQYDPSGLKPSSEWAMHGMLYREREDCQAVVHTHSTYATLLACLGEPLLPIHYLVATAGVPVVPVAPYRLFGSEDLAQVAHETMGEGKAVLLEHHGLLCYGKSLDDALNIAREVEFCAKLYVKAKMISREVPILDEASMKAVMERFKTYGQKGR